MIPDLRVSRHPENFRVWSKNMGMEGKMVEGKGERKEIKDIHREKSMERGCGASMLEDQAYHLPLLCSSTQKIHSPFFYNQLIMHR